MEYRAHREDETQHLNTCCTSLYNVISVFEQQSPKLNVSIWFRIHILLEGTFF